MKRVFAIVFFILMLVVAGFLFRPIIAAFFWALIIAAGLNPLFRWINGFVKKSFISSLVVCLLLLVFLAVPVWQFSMVLGNQSAKLKDRMERLNKSPQPAETDMVQQFRPVVSDIQKFVNDKTMVLGLKIDIVGPYRNMLISVTKAFSNLPKIMEGVSRFLMNIGFFFILLFFLIRFGRELAAYFRSLLPVEPERIDVFFNKFREITYASILSSGVIALTQGLLGLVIYLSLGLEEAFFWAVLTALCSFVPIIGSAGAWLSVTILLLISGSYLKAIIMFVLGVFVISLSDDILRPLLIKGKNNIHPVLLFFSIICGIITMGFIGIFAGPLIMVIVMTALEMYRVNLSVTNRPGIPPDTGNGNSGISGP